MHILKGFLAAAAAPTFVKDHFQAAGAGSPEIREETEREVALASMGNRR